MQGVVVEQDRDSWLMAAAHVSDDVLVRRQKAYARRAGAHAAGLHRVLAENFSCIVSLSYGRTPQTGNAVRYSVACLPREFGKNCFAIRDWTIQWAALSKFWRKNWASVDSR